MLINCKTILSFKCHFINIMSATYILLSMDKTIIHFEFTFIQPDCKDMFLKRASQMPRESKFSWNCHPTSNLLCDLESLTGSPRESVVTGGDLRVSCSLISSQGRHKYQERRFSKFVYYGYFCTQFCCQ